MPQDRDGAVHGRSGQDRRLLHPRLQLRRQQVEHREVRLQHGAGLLQGKQGKQVLLTILILYQLQIKMPIFGGTSLLTIRSQIKILRQSMDDTDKPMPKT